LIDTAEDKTRERIFFWDEEDSPIPRNGYDKYFLWRFHFPGGRTVRSWGSVTYVVERTCEWEGRRPVDHNIVRDAMRRWFNRLLLLALLVTHGVASSSTTHGARRGEEGRAPSPSHALGDAYIAPTGGERGGGMRHIAHLENGDDDGRAAMVTTPTAASSRRSLPAGEEYRGTRRRTTADETKTMATATAQEERTRRRRDQDIEDLLNDMATRDPSEWSGIEWVVMMLFLGFLGWSACCLCALCCCGGCCIRGGGGGGSYLLSDLLRYLCLWELCCRGGRDVAECCDYGLA
jgi:hypothetical protein